METIDSTESIVLIEVPKTTQSYADPLPKSKKKMGLSNHNLATFAAFLAEL